MFLAAFTLAHVVISVAGIGSGFVVMYGLIAAKRVDFWTGLFLVTTGLTSVTGFLFPIDHFTPGHALGILSLLALAVAIFARNVRYLAGAWRMAYVISAVIALYFNVFVLVAQSFQKIPILAALSPTQSEPPFLVAQVGVLMMFIWLGIMATIRFRGEAASQSAMA